MDNVTANALILLQEISDALRRGTKHYDKSGALLTSVDAILDCLQTEGGVTFEPSTEQIADTRIVWERLKGSTQ